MADDRIQSSGAFEFRDGNESLGFGGNESLGFGGSLLRVRAIRIFLLTPSSSLRIILKFLEWVLF
jgi:hypothetical protein